MPFMYCNHSGCNETVKLPAQYCAKHKTLKVPEPLPTLESTTLSDPFNVEISAKELKNTKKTTK